MLVFRAAGFFPTKCREKPCRSKRLRNFGKLPLIYEGIQTSDSMKAEPLDEGLVRIFDIIEQIGKLNKLIARRPRQAKDRSMQTLLKYMRARLLQELKELLENFEIEASDFAAA